MTIIESLGAHLDIYSGSISRYIVIYSNGKIINMILLHFSYLYVLKLKAKNIVCNLKSLFFSLSLLFFDIKLKIIFL